MHINGFIRTFAEDDGGRMLFLYVSGRRAGASLGDAVPGAVLGTEVRNFRVFREKSQRGAAAGWGCAAPPAPRRGYFLVTPIKHRLEPAQPLPGASRAASQVGCSRRIGSAGPQGVKAMGSWRHRACRPVRAQGGRSSPPLKQQLSFWGLRPESHPRATAVLRPSFCVSPASVEEQRAARGHGRSPATRTHGQAAQHRLHRPGDHHHRALHFTQLQR